MSNNKQSSGVEWLIAELGEYFPHEIGGIELMVRKAKAMRKEEIIKSYCDGRMSVIDKEVISAEQYYNEKFGGNND